jgi:aminopeptidase N
MKKASLVLLLLALAVPTNAQYTVVAEFGGAPRLAVNPPWDGGYQWVEDGAGEPWIATSNQGLGASIWWPNKDLQSEEPDSQRTAITVPDPMIAVSNGRLENKRSNRNGTTTYTWFVSSPINNYSIEVNAGDYAHWSETYEGELGPLTMDFWPLEENLQAAKSQWSQTRPMRAGVSWAYPQQKDAWPHLCP